MSDFCNAETGQPIEAEEHPLSTPVFRHVARVIFSTFILTFIASRVMVILIMDQKMPDFFLHVKGTHVHHLNYGIFILSGVGAYLLFRRPSGKRLTFATVVYSIGLGLTFDEFGMWVHLGGSYWQGTSFDAVVLIAAAFGLVAYAPSLNRFRTGHWILTGVISLALLWFMVRIGATFTHHVQPWLLKIEQNGPQ